jgi:hypothetical protein
MRGEWVGDAYNESNDHLIGMSIALRIHLNEGCIALKD